jgi:NADP-dependent 3-hydroxy acid dehydrogenase YdfG
MDVRDDRASAISDAHTAVTSIAGKRVLVTGGTTGIGRAIARLLAAEGAKVFIFGRHEPELEDGLRAIREVGGEANGTIADVAEPKDLERVFKEARKALGGIDILIANAGISGDGVADMPGKDWRYVVETNLTGAMASAREAAKTMEKQGTGHIVLIGSVSADTRGKDSSVYVATKAGMQGFSESLQKELSEKGIRVTLIEPGQVGSDMQESSPAEQAKAINKQEMLRAEDIAVAVHYTLTQPERVNVSQLIIRQRVNPEK